jgi:hypothetical protein
MPRYPALGLNTGQVSWPSLSRTVIYSFGRTRWVAQWPNPLADIALVKVRVYNAREMGGGRRRFCAVIGSLLS